MNVTTATDRIATLGARAFTAAADARARLTTALAAPGAFLPGLMDEVLAAEAKAKPWIKLSKRAERMGIREALAKTRQEATEAVIGCGFSSSTSLVVTAASLAELEGQRRFLVATENFEIDAD
ncbi:hypothetical protein [Streptomyces sp. NRRL S-350]|uniref:hypothetical protein n=1 Tax=Streptomyces sp. NRRL S-350 TaxID=1463902 RepID=UPI0004C15351|nr:hypothetical protein [Streptomyces sp. NRRL S-350]